MAYIKEVHGGTYRRVALSGLLDSMQKLRREVLQRERENKLKMSTPIRYVDFWGCFFPPWYNHTGWLGVKHQVSYLLISVQMCRVIPVSCGIFPWEIVVTVGNLFPVISFVLCNFFSPEATSAVFVEHWSILLFCLSCQCDQKWTVSFCCLIHLFA